MKHSMRWLMMAVLLVCGCDSRESRSGAPSAAKQPAPQAATKIQVLATVYPMADMVERVGGDLVNVEWLVESGQRPEDIELTPALRQRAANGALIVTGGARD